MNEIRVTTLLNTIFNHRSTVASAKAIRDLEAEISKLRIAAEHSKPYAKYNLHALANRLEGHLKHAIEN